MKLLFKSYFKLLIIGICTFSGISLAWGAACCGGGLTTPSIIANDDRAQLTTAYSFSEVVIDNVDSKGIWRKWDNHQQTQTLKIDGAHLLTDLWQAGFSISAVERSRLAEKFSGLGDVSLTTAYEYLPDWDYNPLRPKGIASLQLTLPTGLAKAESERGGIDSRGNGFFALGLGTLLSKTWDVWDAFTSLEIRRSFEKKIANSQFQGQLVPGYGGSVGAGIGYYLRDWRFGPSIHWVYEDPIDLRGSSNISGSVERYATGVVAASYSGSPAWAGTLSYADQTIFGSPINTSLGKTIMIQLQRKWAR